jgi:hypothetical protein
MRRSRSFQRGFRFLVGGLGRRLQWGLRASVSIMETTHWLAGIVTIGVSPFVPGFR